MVFRLGKDKFNEEEFYKYYALKDKDGNPIKMIPDMAAAIKKNTQHRREMEAAHPEQDRWTNVIKPTKGKEKSWEEIEKEVLPKLKKINFNQHEDDVREDILLA